MNLTRQLLNFLEDCYLDNSVCMQEGLDLLFRLTKKYSPEYELDTRILILETILQLDVSTLVKYKPEEISRNYFEYLWKFLNRKVYISTKEIQDKSKEEKKKNGVHDEQYPYIPLRGSRFAEVLRFVKEEYGHRKSFIDVGCGIGDKTLLAAISGLFDDCYGIEYDKCTYNIAIDKTDHVMSEIDQRGDTFKPFVHGDAFKHTYEKYDTVYMYCPIYNREKMEELILHILKSIPEDGIICFVNASVEMKEFTMKYKVNCKYLEKYNFHLLKKN